MLVRGKPVGPGRVIPDYRSVLNSGVGLQEVPKDSVPINPVKATTPPASKKATGSNTPNVVVGVNMIEGHPGGHKDTKIDANWLKVGKFAKG